jgi:hypothetical protein
MRRESRAMRVRRILLAGVTGAVVLGLSATGYAVAGPKDDVKKDAKKDFSQAADAQQNGNSQASDIDLIQVNVCGNTVNVVGALNPAFGNTCTND